MVVVHDALFEDDWVAFGYELGVLGVAGSMQHGAAWLMPVYVLVHLAGRLSCLT